MQEHGHKMSVALDVRRYDVAVLGGAPNYAAGVVKKITTNNITFGVIGEKKSFVDSNFHVFRPVGSRCPTIEPFGLCLRLPCLRLKIGLQMCQRQPVNSLGSSLSTAFSPCDSPCSSA
jgi:hypothetical protein